VLQAAPRSPTPCSPYSMVFKFMTHHDNRDTHREGRRRSGVLYRSVPTYCTYAARQEALLSNYVKSRKKPQQTRLRRTRAAPPRTSTPRGRTEVTAVVTAGCPAPTDTTNTSSDTPVTPLATSTRAEGNLGTGLA
jgi:hypothetical protein